MNFKKIKSDLTATYDDLAKYWGTDIAKPDWGSDELERFVFLVKKNGGSKVLDLGCGSGVQSEQLFERGWKLLDWIFRWR
jgi:ubiquinone/menaquinone biosynthesis C-methylase UbiE